MSKFIMHGFVIKGQNKQCTELLCPYSYRLQSEFAIKYYLVSDDLKMWSLNEHQHEAERDRSKSINGAAAKRVREVIQQTPGGHTLHLTVCLVMIDPNPLPYICRDPRLKLARRTQPTC
jgi:hypothetical protein